MKLISLIHDKNSVKCCNIEDVIILKYSNGKKYIGIISRIDEENNKLYIKENLNHNYIQETEIDLNYKNYIDEIAIVY